MDAQLGSYRSPSMEHARVSDAMRRGVIACPPDASLRSVARTMATHHVHSVLITGGPDAPVRVLGERQLLLGAAAKAEDQTAGSIAEAPVTVLASDPLTQAVRLMTDRGVTHVLVVDGVGHPLGVLSALDVAGVLAWGLA